MPVYRRKDTKSKGWYYKFEIDNVTYKKNIPTARTQRQAEEAERQARDDIHAGRYSTQRRMLFSLFVKSHYMAWAETHNKRYALDATAVKLFNQHCGDPALGQISQLTLERFKFSLLKTETNRDRCYNPTTVNLYLNRVSRMLSLAVEWGFILKNPCTKVERVSVPRRKPRFLLEEEEPLLMASLGQELRFMRPLAQAALFTGFRLSELINLTKPDLDFRAGLIFVGESKWKADPRRFEGNPLSSDAAALFRELVQGSPGIHVFHENGLKVDINTVEDCFRRGADRVGLTDLTFHKLRHTFGTRLGARGFNQKQIARLMGHANTRHTDQYVHSTDAGLREAVESVAAQSRDAMAISEPGSPRNVPAANTEEAVNAA